MWAARIRSAFARFGPAFRRPQAAPAWNRAATDPPFFQRRNYGGYRYQRYQNTKNFFVNWSQRPTFYRDVGLAGAGVGGIYIYNLETVPVSGRRRFNVISHSMEASLGASAYQEVLQQYRSRLLPPSDARVRLVQRVADRLIPHAGLEDMAWEVFVIDSHETNAFVTPGGKIFVFTGLLPICKNEDGVAAVLGHEIAHTVAHHTAERISRALPLTVLPIVIDLTLGLPGQFSSVLLSLLFSLPNGRTQESEADYIGLLMMAKACYNPSEAASLWQRMQQFEQTQGGSPPEFMSTHPSSHNRQGKIQDWMAEAQDAQQRSECGPTAAYASGFRQVVDRWG